MVVLAQWLREAIVLSLRKDPLSSHFLLITEEFWSESTEGKGNVFGVGGKLSWILFSHVWVGGMTSS